MTVDTGPGPRGGGGRSASGRAPAGRAFSEERRLRQLCEWRALARRTKILIRERRAACPGPGDEAGAEREVAARRRLVGLEVQRAESDFWGHLPGLQTPQGAAFVPFVDSKIYTADECLRCPLQEAARRWFRWLCEARAVERAVERASRRSHPWRDTLGAVGVIADRFESADLAWAMHVALCRNRGPYQRNTSSQASRHDRGGGTGEAADWLAAWAAAEAGEAHLRPLMARASPDAGPERLSHELLLEIWAVVLTLRADRLPVPAFSGLPAAVAREVRDLHTDAEERITRLKPATQRGLLALNAPAPDPLESLLSREHADLLRRHVEALPPRQRQALDLAAAGLSRREMAAETGLGAETVKEHLGRARRRVRGKLRDAADGVGEA